jgi:signal transduction histidine kinase/CheY-like chemotaxis protein
MGVIPSLAIFGSIAGQLILAIYLLVQSFFDPERKKRLLTFSFVYFTLGALDSLYSYSHAINNPNLMPFEKYEYLRLFWCSCYIFSIFYMLDLSLKWGLFFSLLTLLTGLTVYHNNWVLATSVSFPMVYWIASFLHYQEFKLKKGYASCILWTFSFVMGISCSIFYLCIKKGIEDILWLGYLHYAIIALIAVLNGWVNLPRELRGLAPVKISNKHAYIFFISVTFFEILFALSLLVFYTDPPILYVVSTVGIILAAITLQLYHKNQLVIYTGDVTKLLDERTESLKSAQIKLAQLSEKQAEKIEVQQNELLIKTEVIGRQRRLEMAAQTAGQVAHDIQNILSPICYQLEQLHEMKKNNKFESLDLITSKFQHQVDLLLDLNGQLLSLARRGRVEFEVLNIKDIVDDIKNNFQPNDLIVINPTPLWAKGSWSQLSRAIFNLTKNAVEANNNKIGPVQIHCKTVTVTENKKCHLGFLNPGEYTAIEVKDNGSGIPNEIMDKIFDPFFSTKSTQTSSGSGLGLSIVNALIEDHKGVLDLITSSKGTSFTIYLLKTAGLQEEETFDLSGNETVLVIDDDSAITRNLQKALSKNNYRVLIANSGQEAIRTMQSEKVDAVVLDFHMPDLNGYQTFYALMHLNPNLKAIMHSSFIFDEDITKLSQIGVQTYLQKPANPKEILKSLRSLFK